MKKKKKMPLVILTLMVLVLIASISIFIFNTRETKNKNSVLLEEEKVDVVKDKKTDEETNGKADEIESVDKTKEENKKKESNNNISSTSSNSKKESTASNHKSTQSSNNTNITDNSKKQEEPVVNQSQSQTNNTQSNNTQSSNNVTTDPYNYITGGVIDAPTKESCLAKGDAILNKHLDELMDYNSMHMDNQKSQDITNLECYPVHKPDQDGWFLNILCNSGNCNSKYK